LGAEPQKRGPRFSKKVIAFAVTQRSRGVRWKDIRNTIKQEFHIRPPSERQMRSWYYEYDGASIDLEMMLREALIKATRDSIPAVALATQQFTLQQGIPALLKALRRNKDPNVAGIIMILSTLEQMVGSKLYEKGIAKYEQERKRTPHTVKITGWMNEPGAQRESPVIKIETHSLKELEKSKERRQE